MKIYLFEDFATNSHALFTDEKNLKKFVADYKKTCRTLFEHEPIEENDYQIEIIETNTDFDTWWNC